MPDITQNALHQLLPLFIVAAFATGCARTPETPATGQAQSAAAAPTSGLTIRFHNDPDPPRTGDNAAQVTVTSADGSAVTDATVSAVYYMPAMPSMGMPEMRSSFALTHQGLGVYSGSGTLVMSGTWNVTVAVSRGGAPLGSQKFTVIAR